MPQTDLAGGLIMENSLLLTIARVGLSYTLIEPIPFKQIVWVEGKCKAIRSGKNLPYCSTPAELISEFHMIGNWVPLVIGSQIINNFVKKELNAYSNVESAIIPNQAHHILYPEKFLSKPLSLLGQQNTARTHVSPYDVLNEHYGYIHRYYLGCDI